ncbi:MAG: glycosyltransferase family 4 protein [Rhodothermales bacterium]
MRILVHDFGGYAFAVQLSRALAQRGHTVCHAYCASLRTTPPGIPARQPEDAARLEIKGLELAAPLDKFAFVKRWRQEREHGRLIAREVERFRPDVVLSGNAPLDAQRMLLAACRTRNIRFVFWLQDLIGVAAHRLLRKKIPLLGEVVGRYYLRLEQSLLRRSDAVVLITEDFLALMRDYGVREATTHVIENWAPLDDMPPRPKNNAWAQAHGLADKTCLLYSGTMGMKHNPDLLLQLALHVQDRHDVRVVVVSQGLGADWLNQQKAAHALDNLVLLGFQPFGDLPDVLAAADVLLAVLEPEAGVFSVPSKVLTYLCAARPVLLAVPPENLATRIVARIEAGTVVSPTDTAAFVEAAASLLDESEQRQTMGRNARAYAETAFDIHTIAGTFEKVLAG